jgi:hypothetical protein
VQRGNGAGSDLAYYGLRQRVEQGAHCFRACSAEARGDSPGVGQEVHCLRILGWGYQSAPNVYRFAVLLHRDADDIREPAGGRFLRSDVERSERETPRSQTEANGLYDIHGEDARVCRTVRINNGTPRNVATGGVKDRVGNRLYRVLVCVTTMGSRPARPYVDR